MQGANDNQRPVTAEQIRAWLGWAMGNALAMAWLEEELTADRARLVHVADNYGLTVAAAAVRLEDLGHRRELVVVALGGRPGALAKSIPPLRLLARQWGAATLRAHTVKPGMARLLRRLGCRQIERRDGGETVWILGA